MPEESDDVSIPSDDEWENSCRDDAILCCDDVLRCFVWFCMSFQVECAGIWFVR